MAPKLDPSAKTHQQSHLMVESDVGSPPFTEDARREWPAELPQDKHGGHSKAKLCQGMEAPREGDIPVPTFGQVASCWCFKAQSKLSDLEVEENERIAEHNENLVQLIETLGGKHRGRRAILRAVALHQGIPEESIDEMIEGESEYKIRVPPELRSAMKGAGLGHTLMPVNILEIANTNEILINEA